MRVFLGLVCAACLSLQAGAILPSDFSSGATLINFDDQTGGNCNLCGPSVTNQYASLGVTFNNPSFLGAETVDSNITPYVPNASPANMLFVEQGGGVVTGVSPFQILFSNPVDMVGFDWGSSLDAYMVVSAYASDGTLLESIDYVGGSAPVGLAGFAGIQESTPFARVDVSYIPSYNASLAYNFSIDNLEFQGPSTAESPEPSTWIAVGAGLAGVIAARRRVLPSR
jgi:hypothetical protein